MRSSMYRPFSAQRAVPVCCSSRCTKPKPPHRPVIMSVARLTDLTTPNSANNLFKLSTVVHEDKFCTIIFVIKFFLSLNSVICSLRIRILQNHSTVKGRVSLWVVSRHARKDRRTLGVSVAYRPDADIQARLNFRCLYWFNFNMRPGSRLIHNYANKLQR
jgi:hypothetical protein